MLGLSVAALAAKVGAQVTVFEPRRIGDNASGVAAGMLAPILEAALDGDADDDPLFREAYATWPAFARSLGLDPLEDLRAGALLLASQDALDRVAARLAEGGTQARRLTAEAARALQPALSTQSGEALYVREDGRIDPLQLLPALIVQIEAHGGELVASVCPPPPVEGFDATVLAAGYETRRWIDLVPELDVLEPIKGHVLHFQGGPSDGPVVRGNGGYAAPQRRGAIFGATMEAGRADVALDAQIVASLQAAAADLLPVLAATPFVSRAGVRASTPDGRPLVGPIAPRLHLAVGARRNGWLLAPLIAQAVLEVLQGNGVRMEFLAKRFSLIPETANDCGA